MRFLTRIAFCKGSVMLFSELRYLVLFTRYAQFYCSTLYADLLEMTLLPVTNVDSVFYLTTQCKTKWCQNFITVDRMDFKVFPIILFKMFVINNDKLR